VSNGDSLPTYDDLARYAPDSGLYDSAPCPIWLDELDLKPAPPHLKMGTRSLDMSTWLTPDQFRDTELAVKRRLFAERDETVFACLPTGETAAREAAELVGEWIESHAGVAVDWRVHPHPLAAVSLHVQEDLALMVFRACGDLATRLESQPVPFTSRYVITRVTSRTESTPSSRD